MFVKVLIVSEKECDFLLKKISSGDTPAEDAAMAVDLTNSVQDVRQSIIDVKHKFLNEMMSPASLAGKDAKNDEPTEEETTTSEE